MQSARVKLLLDHDWTLEDLAVVSKSYNQLYAFSYSLLPHLPASRKREVITAYANLPWRGGYSTVNFFFHVFHHIPSDSRPQVTRITYASPGFIELAAIAAVCFSVSRIVTAVSNALKTAHDTYHHIQKGIRVRKLSKLQANLEELKLQVQTLEFCEKSCTQLVKTLGITTEENEVLEQRTGGNKLMKLKLLMSVYRRVEPLAEKQAQGKLKVAQPEPLPPPTPPQVKNQ